MRTYFEKLRQRPVIDANGRIIGAVDEVVVDTDDWRVKALHVRLRREVAAIIGARRSLFRGSAVEIPAENVQSIGDAVVLRIDARELVRDGKRDEQSRVGRPGAVWS